MAEDRLVIPDTDRVTLLSLQLDYGLLSLLLELALDPFDFFGDGGFVLVEPALTALNSGWKID